MTDPTNPTDRVIRTAGQATIGGIVAGVLVAFGVVTEAQGIAVDLHGDDPDSKQMDATWPVVESHMWCGRFRSSAWRGASETSVSLISSVVSRLATQIHR